MIKKLTINNGLHEDVEWEFRNTWMELQVRATWKWANEVIPQIGYHEFLLILNKQQIGYDLVNKCEIYKYELPLVNYELYD